jgi:hypothetical protein
MMAQATGDLGAVVRRWKCDKSMGKWRETGASGCGASQAHARAAAKHRNISRGAG